ncbi:MAG: HlyC/CorC family transporter [Acidobacteria bacterium]|nr:HlyC/CorC family transporter [Acidobacteriota bacterium]
MTPLALFLLACATVYLGTVEAAFSALMRLSLRLLAERSDRIAGMDRYLDDPIELFVPVRLLIAVATASALVLMAGLIGAATAHAVLALIVATLAFIVICEHLIPTFIVRRNPERMFELLLPSFNVIAGAIRPIVLPLIKLLTGVRRDRAVLAAADDVEPEPPGATPAAESPEPGDLDREDRRLLRSIVEFGDTLVREVMTPRPDIVAIEAGATIDELRALVAEQEYSRFPVYKEVLDNIVGFVFVKDLILLPQAAMSADATGSIAPLVRPPHVVPETKRLAELLKEFQRQQIQMAIVVDEYGGTAGLVTLEDLLEEIVGEIRDEYDVETEPITEQPDGSLSVSGKVDVDKVAERLDIAIEGEGFETVGGFLLSKLGRVPAVGEKFDLDGLSVEILEAERRRITRVRFAKIPAAEVKEA